MYRVRIRTRIRGLSGLFISPSLKNSPSRTAEFGCIAFAFAFRVFPFPFSFPFRVRVLSGFFNNFCTLNNLLSLRKNSPSRTAEFGCIAFAFAFGFFPFPFRVRILNLSLSHSHPLNNFRTLKGRAVYRVRVRFRILSLSLSRSHSFGVLNNFRILNNLRPLNNFCTLNGRGVLYRVRIRIRILFLSLSRSHSFGVLNNLRALNNLPLPSEKFPQTTGWPHPSGRGSCIAFAFGFLRVSRSCSRSRSFGVFRGLFGRKQ
jgi:hypothetical protein